MRRGGSAKKRGEMKTNCGEGRQGGTRKVRWQEARKREGEKTGEKWTEVPRET